MTALELLRRLRRQGVSLWLEGGRLRYRAPRGIMTPALRAELLAAKAEIVALLRAAEPVRRIPRDGVLPLSSIQERLWFLEQLDPGHPAYNIAVAWRLQGPLNLVALGLSLDAIVQRHEVLRAACITQDGRPGLVIASQLQAVLDVADLSDHPHGSKESYALELATQKARSPLDFTQPPLLRAQVFRFDRDTCILLLVTHHFVADGWSMGILLHELSVLYESFVLGKPAPLPELPLQYVDLAGWERRQLVGGVYEKQLAYWTRQLEGAPALLDLPTDRPRPLGWSYRGATHAFALAPELSEALRSLSRREGSTLFLTLLTAFQILLHRYTQRDDMIVGTTVSNRNQQEAENLIGSFANSLALRTDLSGDPTFLELLGRVRNVTWEAFAHQDLPFQELVQALQPQRNTGAHPLYQVSFLLHDQPEEQHLRLSGLVAQKLPIELGTARLDLYLEMFDSGAELSGIIEYSSDLFDVTGIRQIAGRYQTLLDSIVADPEMPISRLPWETELASLQLRDRRSRLSPAKRALLEKRLQGALARGHESQLIPRRARQDAVPLSFAQERFWYLDQLEPGNPAYNRPMLLRLKGVLNVPALEQSLSAILQRHEVLRAIFPSVGGQPVQVITAAQPISLPFVDLGQLPLTERESRATAMVTEEARRPFDLAQGPLMRATLLRMGQEHHLLILVAHHIAFDGWSAGVLVKELGALYEAFANGASSPLPELPIQYADFAHWQRQQVAGEVLKAQLALWRERLAGSLSLNLPTDRSRPAVQTYRGARQTLMLSSFLLQALRTLGRQEEATLFMTLLAAFQTLLHRYTGQDDIVVGSPVAGRTHVETEGLIGCFVNTLVLRTDFSGNPFFRELLRRVKEVSLDAYVHQDVPFEKLVEELQPRRDLSRTPLFQVLFNLKNVPPVVVATPGLEIEAMEFDSETAGFDLSVELFEKDGGLTCFLQYNCALFDATTIARMAGHFRTLLGGIAADPDRRLSDLPLLTEAEQHRLLVQWNATQTDYPEDLCLHQIFEDQVARTPDAIAVVFEDRQLTYRELNRRANQLAHYLRKLGVGPEVLVGICAERSLEMVIAVLGILKAGGAYIPLDPAYPALRLGFMLQDAQTPVLLTQQHLRAELSRYGAQVVCLDTDWRAISAESAQNLRNHTRPTNAVYVIFTSGSTGRPKGVVVEHRSVLNLLAGLQEAIYVDAHRQRHQTRFSLNGPLTFDASVKHLFQLLNGHTLYILPAEIRADGEALLTYLRRHELDVFDCTPSQLELLLAVGLLRKPGHRPGSILVGGEAIGESAWKMLAQAKEIACYNLYGPTECTVDATVARIQPAGTKPTIGRPIANTQVYLLDSQLKPVPVGVYGELCIGGLGLARGYLRRPSLTAERFIPNPFTDEPGARLYRSGDLVRYLPDGNIEFQGRLDHQVKIHSFRVELGEIETILSHHPDVRGAVAMVREDMPDDRRLVAYVVGDQEETTPTTSEIRRFLKQRLPDHMVPSAFVFLEALPRMPSGKVNHGALPAPGTARPDLEEALVIPRTAVERSLAEVWQEVLGVDQVGVYDNFFDLGGHSLLSMQVIARMEKRLGVRINPRDMIRQTLGQLAVLYEERMQLPEQPERRSFKHKLQSAIRSAVSFGTEDGA